MAQRTSALTRALIAAVGSGQVVVEAARLRRYRGIAWGTATSKLPLERPPETALVAVRPRSVDDVVAVVRIARERGVPIVPHGAGTGVQAGASPVQGSILLDVGAMDRILSIDEADRMATVEAGVLLGDLDRAAAAHGLMVGHDPWSQPIATVGGAISTSGVGYLAGKYGSMGEQVLGLEVALATGDVIRTRAVPKSSTGPALRSLFIGAEGVLGVITQADVRLFGVPERRALAGYRFPHFEAGLEAVMEMMAIHLRPAMIDYEEEHPADGALRLGQLADLPSLMYLALDGFEEDVAAQVARADSICRRGGAQPLAEGEAEAFWGSRHEPAERYLRQLELDPEGLSWGGRNRRWSSAYLNMGLAPTAVQAFRKRAAVELAPYRLVVKDSGLWGMPELFSVRLEHQAPDDPTAVDELEEGTDAALRIAQDLGGSMEYCHGVGLRLAHLMGAELGAGFDVLRRVKRALDPDGLMNPGKLGL